MRAEPQAPFQGSKVRTRKKSLVLCVATVNSWLNAAAFAQPALGTYGNLGSSNILGPASITINMGLTRTFKVRENQSIDFRAEAFNVPKHVNPGIPGTILTNSNFGKITSAADPRILQLALKYVF